MLLAHLVKKQSRKKAQRRAVAALDEERMAGNGVGVVGKEADVEARGNPPMVTQVQMPAFPQEAPEIKRDAS